MLHIAPSAIERMHPASGYADRPEQAQALERSPSPQHQARRGKGPHGGAFARRTTGAQTATGGRRPETGASGAGGHSAYESRALPPCMRPRGIHLHRLSEPPVQPTRTTAAHAGALCRVQLATSRSASRCGPLPRAARTTREISAALAGFCSTIALRTSAGSNASGKPVQITLGNPTRIVDL